MAFMLQLVSRKKVSLFQYSQQIIEPKQSEIRYLQIYGLQYYFLPAEYELPKFLQLPAQIYLTQFLILYRSSRSQMFFKIGILKNFAIFKWKNCSKIISFHMSQNFIFEFSSFRHARYHMSHQDMLNLLQRLNMIFWLLLSNLLTLYCMNFCFDFANLMIMSVKQIEEILVFVLVLVFTDV